MRTEVEQLLETFSEVFKLIHQRSYQKLAKANMYPGQPKLLALIRANEGLTQKELAGKTFVKPATITGMLNKLEANGYVHRVSDEADKRIMRVYLTEEGRNLAVQSEQFMRNLTEKLLEGFTEEDMRSFTRLAEKMRDNLQNEGK